MVDGLYLGIMSGTSLDGIDVALVNFKNNAMDLVQTYSHNWPGPLSSRLKQLIEKTDSLDEMLALDQLCAIEYANAAKACLQEAGLDANNVVAIGCHGQTVRHAPGHVPGYTLQIGNASSIAEHTKITTVSDFRSRDIAAGGQGAPLAPAFHKAFFSTPEKKRVVLNIGGIANITLLSKDAVSGFDTGPGNRLIDDWVKYRYNQDYDASGEMAKSGDIIIPLLEELLKDDYFKKPFPKSTGSDYFNLEWIKPHLNAFEQASHLDILATLTALTAKSVSNAILDALPAADELLICGGGIHNQYLVKLIQGYLPKVHIDSTESYGCHPDWVEAVAFAWLARQTLSQEPGNIAEVTGAAGPRIAGGIYYA